MENVLKTIFDSGVQVHASSDDQPMTGLDWDLSDEARKTIDEIESNIRSAEQMGGRLVAG